jgi:hypothetical protein
MAPWDHSQYHLVNITDFSHLVCRMLPSAEQDGAEIDFQQASAPSLMPISFRMIIRHVS